MDEVKSRSLDGIEITVRVERRGAGRNRRYAAYLLADGEAIDSRQSICSRQEEVEAASIAYLARYTDAQLRDFIEETADGLVAVAQAAEKTAFEARETAAKLSARLRSTEVM